MERIHSYHLPPAYTEATESDAQRWQFIRPDGFTQRREMTWESRERVPPNTDRLPSCAQPLRSVLPPPELCRPGDTGRGLSIARGQNSVNSVGNHDVPPSMPLCTGDHLAQNGDQPMSGETDGNNNGASAPQHQRYAGDSGNRDWCIDNRFQNNNNNQVARRKGANSPEVCSRNSHPSAIDQLLRSAVWNPHNMGLSEENTQNASAENGDSRLNNQVQNNNHAGRSKGANTPEWHSTDSQPLADDQRLKTVMLDPPNIGLLEKNTQNARANKSVNDSFQNTLSDTSKDAAVDRRNGDWRMNTQDRNNDNNQAGSGNGANTTKLYSLNSQPLTDDQRLKSAMSSPHNTGLLEKKTQNAGGSNSVNVTSQDMLSDTSADADFMRTLMEGLPVMSLPELPVMSDLDSIDIPTNSVFRETQPNSDSSALNEIASPGVCDITISNESDNIITNETDTMPSRESDVVLSSETDVNLPRENDAIFSNDDDVTLPNKCDIISVKSEMKKEESDKFQSLTVNCKTIARGEENPSKTVSEMTQSSYSKEGATGKKICLSANADDVQPISKPSFLDEEDHACLVCGLFFTSDTNVKLHMQAKHRVKLYRCRKCVLYFLTADERDCHKRDHADNPNNSDDPPQSDILHATNYIQQTESISVTPVSSQSHVIDDRSDLSLDEPRPQPITAVQYFESVLPPGISPHLYGDEQTPGETAIESVPGLINIVPHEYQRCQSEDVRYSPQGFTSPQACEDRQPSSEEFHSERIPLVTPKTHWNDNENISGRHDHQDTRVQIGHDVPSVQDAIADDRGGNERLESSQPNIDSEQPPSCLGHHENTRVEFPSDINSNGMYESSHNGVVNHTCDDQSVGGALAEACIPSKSPVDQDHLGRSMKNTKPYMCAICMMSFKYIWNLHRHTMTHTEPVNEISCYFTGCRSTFNARYQWHEHMMKEHFPVNRNAPSISPMAHQDLSVPQSPQLMNSHNGGGLEESSVMARSEALSSHEERVSSSHADMHRTNGTGTASTDGRNAFECDYEGCERTFSSRLRMNVHLKLHWQQQQRDLSDQRIRSSEHVHDDIEDKRRKKECTTCGKTWPSSCHLRIHMRTHTNERPFKCPQRGCEKAFQTKSNMERHKATHSEKRISQCRAHAIQPPNHSRTKQNGHGTHAPSASPSHEKLEQKGRKQYVERDHKSQNMYNYEIDRKKESGESEHLENITGERITHRKCCFCRKNFDSDDILREHIGTHTQGRRYKCKFCDAWFWRKTNQKTHQKIHDKRHSSASGGSQKCIKCKKVFIKRRVFLEHILCHTEERPFWCHLCGHWYRSRIYRDVHVRTHNSMPNANAQRIDISPANTCQTSAILSDEREMRMASTFGATIESISPERDSNLKSLEENKSNSNLARGDQKCRQNIFEKLSDFYVSSPVIHQSEAHPSANITPEIDPKSWPMQKQSIKKRSSKSLRYKCFAVGCGRTFRKAHVLRDHLMGHTDHRPFKCTFRDCKRAFHLKRTLYSHMRVHDRPESNQTLVDEHSSNHSHAHEELDNSSNKVQIFKCTYKGCSRAFTTRSWWLAHHRTHRQQKKRRLSHQQISPSGNVHNRIGDKDRTYECAICGRSSRTRADLEIHIKYHMNVRPFKCSYSGCGKAFHINYNRKRHEAIHVKNESHHRQDHRLQSAIHPEHNQQRQGNRALSSSSTVPCGQQSNKANNTEINTLQKSEILSRGCDPEKENPIINMNPSSTKHEGNNRKRPGAINYSQNFDKQDAHLKCRFCMQVFVSKDDLREHVKIHTEGREYACNVCDAWYWQHSNLEIHRKIHDRPHSISSSRSLHQCEECRKVFRNRTLYLKHRLSHTDEKPYKCTHCTNWYTTSHYRDIHERTHELPQDSTAHKISMSPAKISQTSAVIYDECVVRLERTGPKLESPEATIKSYSNLVRDENNSQQNIFDKLGDLPESIQAGARTKHAPSSSTNLKQASASWPLWVQYNKGKPPGNLKNHRSFRCTFPGCNRAFQSKGTLHVHRRVHAGQKPYLCINTDCSKAFRHPGALKRHLRIHQIESVCEDNVPVFGSETRSLDSNHTGESPTRMPESCLRCRFCEQIFSEQGDLNEHTSLHTNGRKFPCRYCDAWFWRKINRFRHERTYVGQGPLKCDICLKTIRHLSTLRFHLIVHTKEKPFKCHHCEKWFRAANSRIHHERNTHASSESG